MKGRRRDIHLHVMVTAEELARIRERMDEAGITNAGAYVRKMALNGYILHVDLSPVAVVDMVAAYHCVNGAVQFDTAQFRAAELPVCIDMMDLIPFNQ